MPTRPKPPSRTALNAPSSRAVRVVLWAFALLVLEPADATAQANTCAAYCDLMSDHCSEEVFHDKAFCLSYCGHPSLDVLAPGNVTDTTGNTRGCRIHHALQASVTSGPTREAHCAAAAMTGGGVCGDYCEVYCGLTLEVCNPTNNPDYTGTPLFTPGGTPSMAACMSACSGFPLDVLDGVSQTDQLFGYGDTLQCRVHHLQAAVVEGQEGASNYALHCGHAQPASDGDLCSDIAEPNVINYCVYALRHCSGANAILPPGMAHADCVSLLNGVVGSGDYREDGFASFVDTETNSVGCLNNRIMLAAQDAVTYCVTGDWDRANWTPSGGAVCAPAVAAVPTGPAAPLSLLLALGGLGAASLGLLSWRQRGSRAG